MLRMPRRTAWALAILGAMSLESHTVAQTQKNGASLRPSPYMPMGSSSGYRPVASPYGVIRYEKPAQVVPATSAGMASPLPAGPVVETSQKPIEVTKPEVANLEQPKAEILAPLDVAPATPVKLPDDKPTATMLPEIDEQAKAAATRPGLVTMSKPAGATFSVAECQACLRNVEIMLAWMADPVTFPYDLRARSADGCLEVNGSVPTGQEWAHAMRIARDYSEVLVKHSIIIEPAPRTIEKLPADQLKPKVDGAMAGAAIHGLVVEADDAGRVTLHGNVTSFEDKLSAGKRLQKVAGCHCVDNRLVVLPILCGGVQCVMVTSDGRCVLPMSELPVRLSGSLTQASAESKPCVLSDVVPAVQREARPAAPTTLVEEAACTPPIYQESSRRFSLRRLFRNETVEVVKPIEAVKPVETRPETKLTPMPVSQAPTVQAVPMAEAETLTSDRPKGADTAGLAKASAVPGCAKPMPLRSTDFAVSKTKIQQFARVESNFASDQPRSLPDVIQDQSSTVPTTLSNSGIRQVKAEMPAVDDLCTLQSNLQKQIEKECGGEARDVWVVLRSSKSMLVTLKVANGTAGESCARRILRLPVLAPYQVSLEVEVVAPEDAAN